MTFVRADIAARPTPPSEHETIFFRLLQMEEKEIALADAVNGLRTSRFDNGIAYLDDPSSFSQIPGTPFAYWVSEALRRKFTELPPLEGDGRTVKQGLATADDFRFVRTWWEVRSERILDGGNGTYDRVSDFQAWCRERTFQGKRWVPFAKGGTYSPYYSGKRSRPLSGSLSGGLTAARGAAY